jgi:hypothetical protein
VLGMEFITCAIGKQCCSDYTLFLNNIPHRVDYMVLSDNR